VPQELSAEKAPVSHKHAWKRLHGEVVREEGLQEGRCTLCHQDSACNACHQDEPPADQHELLGGSGARVSAETDRRRCETCTGRTSADRCHRETTPITPWGAWGSPTDTHCKLVSLSAGCGNGCARCHQETRGP